MDTGISEEGELDALSGAHAFFVTNKIPVCHQFTVYTDDEVADLHPILIGEQV